MNIWPFTVGKAARDLLKKQVEANARLCQEHQAVTDRIVEKAERIAKLVRSPQTSIVGHAPRRR